jgi:hypothetical protein
LHWEEIVLLCLRRILGILHFEATVIVVAIRNLVANSTIVKVIIDLTWVLELDINVSVDEIGSGQVELLNNVAP